MFKFFSALIDRVFVVIGAVLFAQVPHFFQFYIQRLGGHMEELKKQVLELEDAAQKSGKTLGEYIGKFMHFSDSDISYQGEFMQSIVNRANTISDTYFSMVDASLLSKPLQFILHFQSSIVKETWQDYSFGLSLTKETLAYAFFGILAGYLLFFLLKTLVILPLRKFIVFFKSERLKG